MERVDGQGVYHNVALNRLQRVGKEFSSEIVVEGDTNREQQLVAEIARIEADPELDAKCVLVVNTFNGRREPTQVLSGPRGEISLPKPPDTNDLPRSDETYLVHLYSPVNPNLRREELVLIDNRFSARKIARGRALDDGWWPTELEAEAELIDPEDFMSRAWERALNGEHISGKIQAYGGLRERIQSLKASTASTKEHNDETKAKSLFKKVTDFTSKFRKS